MTRQIALCAAPSRPRQAFASRLAALLLCAATLGGCSYQLGSMIDESETTGSIRPMAPGAVDPNPNDPYAIRPPGKTAVAPQAGRPS